MDGWGEMVTVTMALLINLISDDVHIFDPDQKNLNWIFIKELFGIFFHSHQIDIIIDYAAQNSI